MAGLRRQRTECSRIPLRVNSDAGDEDGQVREEKLGALAIFAVGSAKMARSSALPRNATEGVPYSRTPRRAFYSLRCASRSNAAKMAKFERKSWARWPSSRWGLRRWPGRVRFRGTPRRACPTAERHGGRALQRNATEGVPYSGTPRRACPTAERHGGRAVQFALRVAKQLAAGVQK